MTPPQDDLRAQLDERIRFESLLADLSTRFVGLPAKLDRGIEQAQRRICETLGLDRSTLGQPNKQGVPQFTHSWASPECMLAPHSPATPRVPWATQRIQSGHSLHFSSLEELPPEAGIDRETFRRLERRR
jgi:formate hydrogenlyase transcriptional activator